MTEREEEFTHSLGNEDKTQLDRPSALDPQDRWKKKSGLFGLILMGLAAVVLIFLFSGKSKPKKEIKELTEFEPAPRKQITLPEAPPQFTPPPKEGPSEEDLTKLQQAEALRLARMKSAIVVFGQGSGSSSANNQSSSGSSNGSAPASSSATQDRNTQFAQGVEQSGIPQSKALSLGSLSEKILQGKLIDAVLETAINSDLPGMIRALVSSDVYSESGNNILIPRGSRLVGQYNSQMTQGQSRVFVIWTRVIRPDGMEVALNSGGTDPLGRAGLSGSVNHHFWRMFGSSLLLSILNAGVSNVGVNAQDQLNSASSYREQIGASLQNTSTNILQNSVNIPPTIEIKQGTRIKVFVNRDLDFSEALALNRKEGVLLP